MNISSLSTSAASGLTYTSRVSGTSSTTQNQQVGGTRPPPPPDGGGLIGAIADALKSIGVAGTSTDETSTDGTTTSAEGTTGATDTTNAAQALGTFLESLMGALHAQQEEGTAPPAYGEPPQGGPGKLSTDLQSLIAELGGTASTTEEEATETSDSVSALQSSFKSLLTALGGDGSDADTQLTSFLQALSSKLPSAGSSGNLIDTSA